ncbi:MAG: hypothetical protein BWY38_03295 [Ignavibacteria bacterium ADurb.Bin266]|nr:MAG: hypothetical protein BWY38_03295 [Ignavibacteria bacterium ADurb.Bin266]
MASLNASAIVSLVNMLAIAAPTPLIMLPKLPNLSFMSSTKFCIFSRNGNASLILSKAFLIATFTLSKLAIILAKITTINPKPVALIAAFVVVPNNFAATVLSWKPFTVAFKPAIFLAENASVTFFKPSVIANKPPTF